MFTIGDWVKDSETGRIGILRSLGWNKVVVRIGSYDVLRYPEEIEPAPLEILEEDIHSMQHLAVEIGDKEWFLELSQRLGGLKL